MTERKGIVAIAYREDKDGAGMYWDHHRFDKLGFTTYILAPTILHESIKKQWQHYDKRATRPVFALRPFPKCISSAEVDDGKVDCIIIPGYADFEKAGARRARDLALMNSFASRIPMLLICGAVYLLPEFDATIKVAGVQGHNTRSGMVRLLQGGTVGYNAPIHRNQTTEGWLQFRDEPLTFVVNSVHSFAMTDAGSQFISIANALPVDRDQSPCIEAAISTWVGPAMLAVQWHAEAYDQGSDSFKLLWLVLDPRAKLKDRALPLVPTPAIDPPPAQDQAIDSAPSLQPLKHEELMHPQPGDQTTDPAPQHADQPGPGSMTCPSIEILATDQAIDPHKKDNGEAPVAEKGAA